MLEHIALGGGEVKIGSEVVMYCSDFTLDIDASWEFEPTVFNDAANTSAYLVNQLSSKGHLSSIAVRGTFQCASMSLFVLTTLFGRQTETGSNLFSALSEQTPPIFSLLFTGIALAGPTIIFDSPKTTQLYLFLLNPRLIFSKISQL